MRRSVFLLCFLFLGFVGQASAERGDHFWLLKGGMLWVDKAENPDSLTSLGLTYGYGITERIALEIDYDQTLSGGAYDVKPPAVNIAEKGEYSMWLASANVAYRHLLFAGLYLKARLGYTYGDESRTTDNATVGDKSDTLHGIGGALGLGYLAGPLIGSSTTFELAYTLHNQDISSAMLGVNLTF